MKKQTYLFIAVALLASAAAQAQLGDIDQALGQSNTTLQNILATLKTWALWIMGLSFIIYAATTVLGGQEGGDKTKKIGSFFMYLGFVGLAIAIVGVMFGI